MRLFEPWRLRGVTFRNRVGVSPMCQYSATDGLANAWHTVHLGSRAVGGAGLVIAEATAVLPEGRISPCDLGLWNDPQADALADIVRFVEAQGAVAGIQLAHAGRKASTAVPWLSRAALSPADSGWTPLGPSAQPFGPGSPVPQEMDEAAIERVIAGFEAAASRAATAGFRFVELHFAHGYLVHQFLSPLSNVRTDRWGASFEGRCRLARAIAVAARGAVPDDIVLCVRLSTTDWIEGGWTVAESVLLAAWLRADGVDMIDCSSGAIVPGSAPPGEPGVHRAAAHAIRTEADIPTAVVGLITEPGQAQQIVVQGEADLVLLARGMLADPYWPIHAARALDAPIETPPQYRRGLRDATA